MTKTVKTFRSNATVTPIPVWNRNATLSFRYDKDVIGKVYTYKVTNGNLNLKKKKRSNHSLIMVVMVIFRLLTAN